MPTLDKERCAVCGWPLEQSAKDGCVRGNCCKRPLPATPYDATRAVAEGYARYSEQVGDCADEVYEYVCEWLRHIANCETPQRQLDVAAIRAIIDEHSAALREEVERLRREVVILTEWSHFATKELLTKEVK